MPMATDMIARLPSTYCAIRHVRRLIGVAEVQEGRVSVCCMEAGGTW